MNPVESVRRRRHEPWASNTKTISGYPPSSICRTRASQESECGIKGSQKKRQISLSLSAIYRNCSFSLNGDKLNFVSLYRPVQHCALRGTPSTKKNKPAAKAKWNFYSRGVSRSDFDDTSLSATPLNSDPIRFDSIRLGTCAHELTGVEGALGSRYRLTRIPGLE